VQGALTKNREEQLCQIVIIGNITIKEEANGTMKNHLSIDKIL